MVAREEVAGLVLEWLRRENLFDTAAALSREAATLLDRLTKPENRRVRDLTALLNAHVLLLQKKKQKRDLKQSFLLRYPEILPQTFHAFLRLLDDYQLMTSSVPTTSTGTTTATFPHAASLSSSPLSSLPLSPPGSVPRSPGGFYAQPTHSRPPEAPRSTGDAATAASAGAIGSGGPPGRQPLVPQIPKHIADAPQRRGRGRKPAVPPPSAALLSAMAAQRTLAPLSSPLVLSTPGSAGAPMPLTFARPQPPVARLPPATPAPTTSNGSQQLPTAAMTAQPTSFPRTRPPPTPTPATITTTAATTMTTTTAAAAVVAPSPLTSPPPASVTFAAPVAPAPAPTAKAPAPSSSSSSSTNSSIPPVPSSSAAEAFAAPLPLSTSSSPSKRKRQTPRKRKIEAVATEVIGHSSKAPRTSAHPTPSTSTSTSSTTTVTSAATATASADNQLDSAEALFAAGGEEMMVLDDSFFEMLLKSDLPEKLAEQINRNLRSEAEQQQQQQEEREQARLAREAEAAALAAQEPAKTIEEIVEAVTHGPAFEALLSQWDAEILDDEGEGEGEDEAVGSDQYEEIIDEYDDELSISDDDDDADAGDDNHHKGDQGGDAAATTAAAEEEEDHGGKVIAEEEDEEEEASAPPPTAPSSGGRERVATAEKLKSLDLDAFLNTIHGPKQ